MTEPNSNIPVVSIDGKHYAVDNLSQEAKDVVATLAEHEQVANTLKTQLKHVNVGAVALTNALRELLKDVEPLELTDEAEKQLTPVSVSE